MPARSIALSGLKAVLDGATQRVTQEAAQQIVSDLIALGPWYSGQFAKNWVVQIGNKKIPAVVEPDGFKGRTTRSSVPIPLVPSLRGTGKKKTLGYTIGNRTTYRNIAMDLVPGRVTNARVISAPQDWYRNYVEGGPLRDVLIAAIGKIGADPKVRGYKKTVFIGPTGRLVR